AIRRLRAAGAEAPQEWHPEGLWRVPARHVHDARRRDQRGPAGLHPGRKPTDGKRALARPDDAAHLGRIPAARDARGGPGAGHYPWPERTPLVNSTTRDELVHDLKRESLTRPVRSCERRFS